MAISPDLPDLAPAASAERAPAARSQDRGPGTRDQASARWLVVAAIAAAVAGGLWCAAALITANRGFDTSDEGFYLLSYRWWSTDYRTFTGVQYLYGPVFQVLGYNIAALRVFRLLTILSTSLVFGWAFMRWLRLHRPNAPASPWWEIAGIAAIVACGGMVYSWLPLTPGYNDVALLGGLLAASIVLRLATAVTRGSPISFWLPAALGPVVVASLLAKWTSSALTLAIVAVAAAVVLAPRGLREFGRVTAWALAGALITVGLVQVFVVPLGTALPQMLATNRLVAAATNSPLKLLALYASTSGHLLATIATRYALLLIAAVLAAVARGKGERRIAAVFAAASLCITGWQLIANGDLRGGTVNLSRFPVSIIGVLVVAIVLGLAVVLSSRNDGTARPSLVRSGSCHWPIVVMLALLPVTQAAGTGNPLYEMAVNGFAAWAAIVIAVLTGIDTAASPARWLAAAMAAAAVAMSASIAADALWSHPYRTVGYHQATASAVGVPALASIRLDPRTARGYSRLHHLLLPYIEPAGRAMMGFDEIPGVVLLLDGRPVGEAWYSATDHARTAIDIRSQCTNGHGWWASRDPILIFRRAPADSDIGALRACGLIFPAEYQLLASSKETMGLKIYVPSAKAPERQR